MPGTVKIWWHDGASKDARYSDLPVVSEPELGFQTLAVGLTAVASGPAPLDAVVAVIESDVNLRYQVRAPGVNTPAHAATSKPLPATGFATDTIGVTKGCTISFIEV